MASMSIEEMRLQIIDAYGRAPSWICRVRHMNQNQVIAIYLELQERKIWLINNAENDIEKLKMRMLPLSDVVKIYARKQAELKAKALDESLGGHQITLDEYFKEA